MNLRVLDLLVEKTTPLSERWAKKIGGGTRPPWPTSINLTDESHIFVQLPAQVKFQQGNNIKTKEVMLKIMSPGKVKRAQSRAKGVYSGGDTARARGAQS